MSDWRNLISLCNELREAGERALLFSIVDIDGSSYRKLGAHMLVGESSRSAGTISAGCLESDLLSRVDDFFAGQLPRVVSYDNRGDDVFALNAGCTGSICILVEDAFADARNPLSVFAEADAFRVTGKLATIIAGPEHLVGTRLSPAETGDLIARHELTASAVVDSVLSGDTTMRVSVEFMEPPLRLIVFGAQQDGRLLADLAGRTGMNVTLADWRPRLLETAAAQSGSAADQTSATVGKAGAPKIVRTHGCDLGAVFDGDIASAEDSRIACVLMSHNYDQDKAALAAMLECRLPYIGVMGPRKRTRQMLGELGREDSEERLNFPVGLDIGADSPEEIAVSIVAEVISVFAGTSSKPLKQKGAPIHAAVN